MKKDKKSCPSCGMMKCACGGKMKKMAKGGKVNRGDGCCMKGKTKGAMR